MIWFSFYYLIFEKKKTARATPGRCSISHVSRMRGLNKNKE